MKRLLIPLIVVGVLLVACDTDKAQEQAKSKATCTSTPSPLASIPSSAAFPSASGVTITSVSAAGPSTKISGYSSASVTELWNSYKSLMSQGGFSVTKSENDVVDAEVNFAGNNTTGQVKLANECAGRTSVDITIRPAK
jgi:hypothetical protein